MSYPLIKEAPEYVNWGAHRTGPSNKKAREILKFNFEDLVERRSNGFVFKKKNRPLLSPSTLCYTISKYNMCKIPDFILEPRRELGSNLMENLKHMFENKIYDTSNININDRDRNMLNHLVDWLMENKIRILAVEKFITNGVFCGFMDVVVSWNSVVCILEIKCRNKQDIRFTDIVQSVIYSRMLSVPCYIVMIDDFGKVSYQKAPLTRRYDWYTQYEMFMKFWKQQGVLETSKVERIDLSNEELFKKQEIETNNFDTTTIWD